LLNISCYLESVYEICFLGWAQWNSVINKEGGFLGEKLQRYQGEKRGADAYSKTPLKEDDYRRSVKG